MGCMGISNNLRLRCELHVQTTVVHCNRSALSLASIAVQDLTYSWQLYSMAYVYTYYCGACAVQPPAAVSFFVHGAHPLDSRAHCHLCLRMQRTRRQHLPTLQASCPVPAPSPRPPPSLPLAQQLHLPLWARQRLQHHPRQPSGAEYQYIMDKG
jgi:hypothetical protein